MLVAAVASVADQLGPGDDVVLVIDHNDELRVRAAREFAADPRIRVIANTLLPGISGARNSAIDAARGEVVAFLDDDAVAGPGWLERIRAAMAEPDVLAVGVAAAPAWHGGRRPSWFPDEYDWVVGCTYRGLPTSAGQVRNVNGAAMALRRDAVIAVGGFSTMVGRRGAAFTGCEETELCIRLRQRHPDAKILYLPDVSVAHTVPRERMRIRYFLRRCYGEGLSKARVARLVGAADGLSSERSYVWSTLPRGVARQVGRGLRGRLGGWLAAVLIVTGVGVTATGYLLGRLRPDVTAVVSREATPVARL